MVGGESGVIHNDVDGHVIVVRYHNDVNGDGDSDNDNAVDDNE